MGTFRAIVEVGDPTGSGWVPVQVLVDTGASHTVMPASVLQPLGVRPCSRGAFRLADGRRIEREMGQTWIRVDGAEVITQVVFGDEGVEPLLGVVTLEELRLGVDPVSLRIIPVDGLLMQLGLHCPITPIARHG